MLSLNYADDFDGDEEKTELLDFLADDKTVDLDLRLDARRFLQGCPRRLVQIAHKITSGENLTPTDSQYLWRYHKREQKRLLAM